MAGTERETAAAGDPGRGAAPAPGFDRVELALALLAFALGGLAFAGLGRPSLWLDEGLTWQDAVSPGGNYNRLGYALVRWTVEALGGLPTESHLRFTPALAGWLAVVAVAWAFRPLVGGRRAAAAALVVAVSPWHVYWAQNARFYSLVELCTVLGAGLALRGLALTQARGLALLRLGGALALFALGALFHLQALLALASLGCALLAVRPGLRAAETPDSAGAAGATVPDPARRERQNRLAVRLGVAAAVLLAVVARPALEVFERYVFAKGGGGGLSGAAHALRAIGFTLGPGLGAAFLCGAAVAWRAPRRAGRWAALVPCLGVAAVLALGFVTTTTAQYALWCLPWFAAVAVWPLAPGAWAGTAARACGYLLVVAGPLAASTGLQLGVRHGDRPRWREALALVEARREPGDLVVTLPGTLGEHYAALGTFAAGAPPEVRERLAPTRVPDRAAGVDTFHPRPHERPARDGRTVWIVVRPDFLLSWRSDAERARFQAFLRDGCRLEGRFPVRIDARDLDLEVWRTL